MTYNIKRTDGTTFTVQPGTVDGPANTTGGFTPETDLDIYGQGTLNWGIGVDQNMVHLLESWACPSVATTIVDGEQQYRPQTATEIGVAGAGINQPVVGQQWFNTTNGKLYVCYDVGTGTAATALWKTAGADPDLYVPVKGGTFTGNIEISKTDPVLQVTSTDGTDIRFEMRDPSLKFVMAVDQTLYPIGATDYPYDLGVAQTVERPVDHVILQKTVGTTLVSEMRMRDDYFLFSGGTFGIAGADAGKIRTPATVPNDNDLVVTTKGYVDSETVSSSGDTMTGNLRIEKDSPVFAIEATGTGNAAAIFFDHANVANASIRSIQNGTNPYLSLRKMDGLTTQNELRMHEDYIQTYGTGGKIRTPSTIGGPGFGDVDTTLVTKDYVDAITTSLSNDYVENSGDSVTGTYRFGPAFDDTVILNAQIISTLTANNRTTIAGPNILSENGQGFMRTNITPGDVLIHGEFQDQFTQIVGPNVTVSNGSAQNLSYRPGVFNMWATGVTQTMNFVMGPGTLRDHLMSWYIQSDDPGLNTPTLTNKRAGIEYRQSVSGSQIDRFRISRKFDTGTDAVSLDFTINSIDLLGSGGQSVNDHRMRMWGELNTPGEMGYEFWEGEMYDFSGVPDESIASRGGVRYNSNTNEIRLITEFGTAGDLSTATRTQVNLTRFDGIQTNKRFDFAANVWTQADPPRIDNNGSDRNQRGVSAGTNITAEARLGDIYMTTNATTNPAFAANGAYIACGDGRWRRIDDGSAGILVP